MRSYLPFSTALTGLVLVLSFTVESHAKLAKRAPSFIEEWPLYKRWQLMTDIDFDVPESDVLQAEFTKEENTLRWKCYELVLGDTLYQSVDSILTKADWKEKDSEEPAKTVVAKRSSGSKAQVVYGGLMQDKVKNDNVLEVIAVLGSPTGPRARPHGWLIIPFIESGSLDKHFGDYADQATANGAFKQILTAIAATADAGIIHRDIKPQNFLKDGDTVKLMDFDMAREADSVAQFDVGTDTYNAPEIIAQQGETGTLEYDHKVDTFSAGMTFLTMSVPDLQSEGSESRYQLWKDVIEPNGQLWPTADQVADVLRDKKYPVFDNNEGLLKVIAKSLCKPSERYDPGAFKTAFEGAV